MKLHNSESIIIQIMQKYNILPFTSQCDSNCIFCSHKNNPSELVTWHTNHRRYENIIDSLDFLDNRKKIVIGESATKLIEGEPFLHPQIIDVLKELRKKHKNTLVSITTNGNFLSKEIISILAKLKPLEVNLSINAVSYENRKKLMGNKAKDMLSVIKNLNKYKFFYHGSIVALPWITGWNEITKTIKELENNNCLTIRVFLPGYTKFAKKKISYSKDFWNQLDIFIANIRKEFQIPISLEPPRINNLLPIITGVIKNTPAYEVGLKSCDVILSVNNESCFSRVDAFNKIKNAGKSNLIIKRQDSIINVQLDKNKNDTSGLVMDFDFDKEVFDDIKNKINKYKAKSVLVLCSCSVVDILKKILNKLKTNIYVDPVENSFFGGSIMAAGLLVVDDFKKALRIWHEKNTDLDIDLVILPGIAFDITGKDLLNNSYLELKNEINCPVTIV